MGVIFRVFSDGRAAGSAPISGSDFVTKNYLTESIILGTARSIETIVINGTASTVSNKTASINLEFPGSGGLPAVTSVDNGKILMVVSGSWALVDPNPKPVFSMRFEGPETCYPDEEAYYTLYGPEDDNIQAPISLYQDGTLLLDEVYLTDGRTSFSLWPLEGDYWTIGSHSVTASFPGDSRYLPNTVYDSFNVIKRSNLILVDSEDIDKGQTVSIWVTCPDDYTGDVSVNVNGISYVSSSVDGKVAIAIPNLPAGAYTIQAQALGNDVWEASEVVSGSFTVHKISPAFGVEVGDVYVGDTVHIGVTAPEDLTGTLTCQLSSGSASPVFVATKSVGASGNTLFTWSNAGPAGTYTGFIGYLGDGQYEPATCSISSINILEQQEEFPMLWQLEDGYVDDILEATLWGPEDDNIQAPISVYLDGDLYANDIYLTDGYTRMTLGPDGDYWTAGTHSVTASFPGDSNYSPSVAYSSFNISKYPLPLGMSEYVDEINREWEFDVTVPTNYSGSVEVELDGVGYTFPVVNGRAFAHLTDLSTGLHEWSLQAPSSSIYEASEVVSGSFYIPLPVSDDRNGTLTATLPDGATGTVAWQF